MKSVIETSVYLIIMVLICCAGIDFVTMNMRVAKVNEVAQYMEDYIEINSKLRTDTELDQVTVNVMNAIAADNNMKMNYSYEAATTDYIYWNVNLEYSLKSELFGLGREHTYTMLARTQRDEG